MVGLVGEAAAALGAGAVYGVEWVTTIAEFVRSPNLQARVQALIRDRFPHEALLKSNVVQSIVGQAVTRLYPRNYPHPEQFKESAEADVEGDNSVTIHAKTLNSSALIELLKFVPEAIDHGMPKARVSGNEVLIQSTVAQADRDLDQFIDGVVALNEDLGRHLEEFRDTVRLIAQPIVAAALHLQRERDREISAMSIPVRSRTVPPLPPSLTDEPFPAGDPRDPLDDPPPSPSKSVESDDPFYGGGPIPGDSPGAATADTGTTDVVRPAEGIQDEPDPTTKPAPVPTASLKRFSLGWQVVEPAPAELDQIPVRQQVADALRQAGITLHAAEHSHALSLIIGELVMPALQLCIDILEEKESAVELWRRGRGAIVEAGHYFEASERMARQTEGGGDLLEILAEFASITSFFWTISGGG